MPKVWLFFFFVSHIGMDLFLQFQYKLPSVQTIFAVFIVSAVVKLLPSFKAFLPAVHNDELTVTFLSTETFFFYSYTCATTQKSQVITGPYVLSIHVTFDMYCAVISLKFNQIQLRPVIASQGCRCSRKLIKEDNITWKGIDLWEIILNKLNSCFLLGSYGFECTFKIKGL